MADQSNLWLVINGASGSNDPAAVRQLIAGLKGRGSTPSRVIDVQLEDAPDRAALNAAGVELLAVFAGDGTTNDLATGLEGWGGQLLVFERFDQVVVRA